MTCTITKEKNRITGEQWVWEYASAYCTLAAAEVIQIQRDVIGNRLMLQTSDLELSGCKTYSCLDLTFWSKLVFSSTREDHSTILCRLPRASFPASLYLQAFAPGITVLGQIICATEERALGYFLSHSPRMGRMKTFQMNSLCRCWHLLTCYSLPHPFRSLRAAGAQEERHVQT